jgi:hypothetical protein
MPQPTPEPHCLTELAGRPVVLTLEERYSDANSLAYEARNPDGSLAEWAEHLPDDELERGARALRCWMAARSPHPLWWVNHRHRVYLVERAEDAAADDWVLLDATGRPANPPTDPRESLELEWAVHLALDLTQPLER